MKRARFWFPLVLACSLAGCGKTSEAPSASKSTTGPTANPNKDKETPAASPETADANSVELRLVDFAGARAAIDAHRGKIVVMDVWSTSCEPCMREFPGLVELHRKWGPSKVACLSLCVDYIGGKKRTPDYYREGALEFLKGQKAAFENFLCTDKDSVVYEKLESTDASIPLVFVYDAKGVLAKRFDNLDPKKPAFTYADVEREVAELSGKPN